MNHKFTNTYLNKSMIDWIDLHILKIVVYRSNKTTDNKVIKNKWKTLKDLPAKTHVSDTMSLDLQRRGFKFVGSTICYAFMQAAGMVNDHLVDCYRYKEV